MTDMTDDVEVLRRAAEIIAPRAELTAHILREYAAEKIAAERARAADPVAQVVEVLRMLLKGGVRTDASPTGALCAQAFYDAQRALAAYDAAQREETKPHQLAPEQVQWVVNSDHELGVKIGDQFFFLYKGESISYEPDETTKWRLVGKREFGETCTSPWAKNDPCDSESWRLMSSGQREAGR